MPENKYSEIFVERWKSVVGFEGLYEVSDLGRVRSLPRLVKRNGTTQRVFPGKILKRELGKTGHCRLALCKFGKVYRIGVHRLVLTAFVGPCPPGMQGCHFPDRNPENCRLENLRWGTPRQNQLDRFAHGTNLRGSRHPMAKLNNANVREIRRRAALGETRTALAKEYGITTAMACYIVARKFWKHIK